MGKDTEIGNPETLDRAQDASAFARGGDGVFRPGAGALREGAARDVPPTGPMAAVSDEEVAARIAAREAARAADLTRAVDEAPPVHDDDEIETDPGLRAVPPVHEDPDEDVVTDPEAAVVPAPEKARQAPTTKEIAAARQVVSAGQVAVARERAAEAEAAAAAAAEALAAQDAEAAEIEAGRERVAEAEWRRGQTAAPAARAVPAPGSGGAGPDPVEVTWRRSSGRGWWVLGLGLLLGGGWLLWAGSGGTRDGDAGEDRALTGAQGDGEDRARTGEQGDGEVGGTGSSGDGEGRARTGEQGDGEVGGTGSSGSRETEKGLDRGAGGLATSEATPAPAAEVERAEAPVVKPAPQPVAKPAPQPVAKPAPKPAPEPAAAKVEVTISSEPAGATVAIDGRALGTTPLVARLPAGALVMVEAKAEGWATTIRAVKVGDEPSSVQVKLLPE